jgi:hypothetical protein
MRKKKRLSGTPMPVPVVPFHSEKRKWKIFKILDALEWLTAMCSQSNRGEQMVRYYGYYSNVSGGKKTQENQDEWMPTVKVRSRTITIGKPLAPSKATLLFGKTTTCIRSDATALPS